MIDEVLGVTKASHDRNEDGALGVVDPQIVVRAVLNLNCKGS